MKKLGFIFVFFAVIISGGWAVHTYFHSQPKTDNVGVTYLINEGDHFLNRGRYDEAKRSFLAALKVEPKNVQADWGLKKTAAKELLTLDGFKLAIDALYQQNPSDAHVNLFMGEFYLATHELDKAYPYFEQAIAQNPKLAEAYFAVAMLHEQQGNINRAKSDISLAIDIAPTPKYRNKLAHIYIKQNHLDAAVAEYEKIPEFPLSALDSTAIYWQRDRLDIALIRQLQALQWLNDKSVMAKPENQDPWFFDISGEQVIALRSLDEKKSYAYLCLAFSLFFLENVEEAERYIQEMRNLAVARQSSINTIANAKLDALVQENKSLATQTEAFKKLYMVATTPP